MAKLIKWDNDSKEKMESIIQDLRDSLVTDAESYAVFMKNDIVDIKALEIALYKTIMTLNEINKATIIQTIGPIEGIKIIQNFENRAIEDVTWVIYEDLMEHYDDLPDEIKVVLDAIKKRMDEAIKKNKEK